MNTTELVMYRDLLGEIKTRVRQGQQRAALSANAEMLFLYWDIGRMIAGRQEEQGWGAGVIPRLATDLKNELPEERGFSERNIKLMVQFFNSYQALFPIGPRPVPQLSRDAAGPVIGQPPVAQFEMTGGDNSSTSIVQRAVAQLSWAHNIILIQKIRHLPTRIWYARKALEQGWTRNMLSTQIKNRAHERQGKATTNFSTTLPAPHAEIAQQLLKDPYLFDFLTLEEPFHECELEAGLLTHIQKFLLELGRGFAFVGRQYRLEVADKDFSIDLLFYHLRLRCFVVVDLKVGEFKPEYAGKMNFYCSVVDDQLRHASDQATVGLILCQSRDGVIAEYAPRDIHKPIGVADYELTRSLPKELASSLPSIEDIEAELSKSLKEERQSA